MNGLQVKTFGVALLAVTLLGGWLAPQLSAEESHGKLTITRTTKEKVGNDERVVTKTTTISDDNAHVTLWKDVTIKADEKFESVVAMMGNVDFYGETNELVVMGGKVHLYPGSKVNGELVVMGGDIQRDDGATVNKQSIVNLGPLNGALRAAMPDANSKDFLHPWYANGWGVPAALAWLFGSFTFQLGWKLACYLFLFAVGLLVLYCFPRLKLQSSQYLVQHLGASFGWGLLMLIIFVPVIVMLLVSLIGIPLIPLFCILYALVWFGGYILGALELGRILPVLRNKQRDALALLFGLLSLCLISYLPWLGSTFVVLLMITGVGATAKTILDRLTGRRMPVAPAVPATVPETKSDFQI